MKRRIMRFEGGLDEVPAEIRMHLQRLEGVDLEGHENAKVIMIRSEDSEGEMPEGLHRILQMGGEHGSTAEIEIHRVEESEHGGQIGDRVFRWIGDEVPHDGDGSVERRGNEHSSRRQIDIQLEGDEFPVDIQSILKKVGALPHEGTAEIEIHTIVGKDGDRDETWASGEHVFEWNGDLGDLDGSLEDLIREQLILIDSEGMKAKAGNKKAPRKNQKKNNNKKNKKKNNKKKDNKKKDNKKKDNKKKDNSSILELKDAPVLTLNGKVVL
jgi:hypothetical protein